MENTPPPISNLQSQQPLQGVEIPLSDDGTAHRVRVVMGERAGAKRLEPEDATETGSTVLPTA